MSPTCLPLPFIGAHLDPVIKISSWDIYLHGCPAVPLEPLLSALCSLFSLTVSLAGVLVHTVVILRLLFRSLRLLLYGLSLRIRQ
jgi:hypothetical protein